MSQENDVDEATEPLTDTWVDRIELAVVILLQISIAAISVTALVTQHWLTSFSGAVVFFLTFAPALLEHRLKVQLPLEVTVVTSLFLFASFVLGEIGNFYERIWWWDLLLHGSSALVIGLIGFLTIYVFYMTNRIKIMRGYMAAFAFGIAVTIGTLWEIFEFLMDYWFGLNMQRSGLLDTMTDLIVNSCGAFFAATLGYFYLGKLDETSLGRQVIKSLLRNI